QDTKEKDIKNYQSIVVRNCGFEECEKLSCFLFNVQGNINNLCIQNIFADYPSPSVLSGFNSKLNIHHIELSNFHLGEKKTMSLPESLIDLKFVDSFSFNINSPKVNFRPIPGFTIVKNQASAPRIIVERPWRSYIVKIAGEKKSTVRYTINGTNPNETSTLYIEPFNILDEKTIKYRTFKKGSIPSKICQYDLGSIYLPAAKPKNLKSGLLYKYFEGHWNMLPDFKKLTEKKRGTIKVLDISTIMKIRTSDSYGIILEGFIKIPITDEYVFSIMSDDGSRVIVDNNVVVDNDGAHYSEEKSGSIKLAFGYHFFRVDFFNKNGTESFALALSGKASYRLPIQEKMLFH
ncbi:MAG TPA: PA14 domain-containing protein, partial [Bacteroidales bacterium]